jgi:D-alanyl-D-alanine carboxypeptidase
MLRTLQRCRFAALVTLLVGSFCLNACAERAIAVPGNVFPTPAALPAVTADSEPVPTLTFVPATPTPFPTATRPAVTLTPFATPTVTPSPTPDRTIPCSERLPADDLLTVVTLTYGLSRDYEPADLVELSGYLRNDVTLGYPTQLRRIVVGPLVDMITAMTEAGLRPTIISGYRSYSAQAIAYQKWLEKEPERVGVLSAPPGFSEHQLGTVVDFGSPELPEIVGQEDIEFHTYFYKTSEGVWLLENAHKFGFTLSYPFEAMEVTGFFYEPWHFRYVGAETASRLSELGISLTEQQLSTEPPPCVPEPE